MTDLLPIYRPDYGKDDCDFINLEGEFEFRADMGAADAYTILRKRAELIGGIVTHEPSNNFVQVFPWNGPGSFKMYYDKKVEPFSRIEVVDRDGETVSNHPMEQMKERGEAAQVGVDYLNEHMEPADEETREPNWCDGEPTRHRIDFDRGELVPIDEDGNEIEDDN